MNVTFPIHFPSSNPKEWTFSSLEQQVPELSRWSLTSRNALFDRVQRLKESEVEIIFVKHDLLKRILSIFFMILCAPFALFSEEAAVDLEESWRATSIRLLPSKKTHATAGELLYYEMLRSSGGFY